MQVFIFTSLFVSFSRCHHDHQTKIECVYLTLVSSVVVYTGPASAPDHHQPHSSHCARSSPLEDDHDRGCGRCDRNQYQRL